MLKFRNTTILFTVIIAVLLLAKILLAWPVWPIGIAALIYLTVLFFGSYRIDSQFYLPVVCSAKTNDKKIAISFDDGPDEHYTPRILSTLKEFHFPAIFFCIGKKIGGREKILKAITDAGHLVGNHSFSHDFWFSMKSAENMNLDLSAADDEIKKIIGVQPKLFRPPYGVTNPNIRKAVEYGRYTAVGWSIRSMDTVINDRNKLLSKLKSSLRPGAVILFHDTSLTMAEILPEFFQEIKNRGYEVVRIDQLLNLKPYA
ncbi:polysaccharide deacetylase family protein [Pollutibacter soli]|uniref:polysaccharide deacetylase family protein n=1 Tax=Pollutibacter soli TaxID=3034157 RepID=UPI0030136CA8